MPNFRVLKYLSIKAKIILIISILIFLTILPIIGVWLSNYRKQQYFENVPNISEVIDEVNTANNTKFIIDTKEYSNAINRFVSEYEMFKTDLSSGMLDFDNLSLSQSKIYNITNISSSKDIIDFEANNINKITTFPSSKELVRNIIKFYSKNPTVLDSVETNYTFWYTSYTGVIIYAPANSSTESLNLLANINQTSSNNANWIDICN